MEEYMLHLIGMGRRLLEWTHGGGLGKVFVLYASLE